MFRPTRASHPPRPRVITTPEQLREYMLNQFRRSFFPLGVFSACQEQGHLTHLVNHFQCTCDCPFYLLPRFFGASKMMYTNLHNFELDYILVRPCNRPTPSIPNLRRRHFPSPKVLACRREGNMLSQRLRACRIGAPSDEEHPHTTKASLLMEIYFDVNRSGLTT